MNLDRDGPALLLIGWAICAIAAGTIASHRADRGVAGFVAGALLGPLGVVVALMLERPAAAAVSVAFTPSIADELAKLAALHQAGQLDDAEFAVAKRAVLGGDG